MKATRLIIALVVIAAAAGAGYFFREDLKRIVLGESSKTKKKSSEPGERPSTVTSLGRLEPESEIVSVGGPTGMRIDRLGENVGEGKPVKKDDPLAYLDSHAEMEAAYKHAKAMEKEATDRYDAETTFGQANIKEAELRIRQADEIADLGIKAQEAEVRRCDAELKKLDVDLGRAEKMYADRAIPKSMLDSAQLAKSSAVEQLARGQAMLKQMTEDRKIKIDQAKAALVSAKAALTRGQVMTQRDSMVAAVALAEARKERTIIRAPIEGEIIKIKMRPGETIGQDPILMMGNTKQMYVVAQVYETYIRHIKKGQKATIESKSLEKKIHGVVDRIGTVVQKKDVFKIDPTADADARVFEVRIRLDKDDSAEAKNYNNLQVDVTIDTK